jgi:hypothetical protein
MLIKVKIDNVYDEGTIQETRTVNVPEPPSLVVESPEHEDWAYDNLFCLTGTGRYAGNDAGETSTPDGAYFLEILSADEPALVGKKYEWGL